MDGVPVTLQAAEEAECEDAHGQADERDHNAHASDDRQQQLVLSAWALENDRMEGEDI